MAIDSVRKRASSVGCYWPTAEVDRIASLWEYSGLDAGPLVPPDPLGVPELRGLTMHRTDVALAARSGASGVSSRRGGSTLSIRRRGK